MNFFFDRNLACRLARMLDQYDPTNTIRHQDDDSRFDSDAEDVDIIGALAADRPLPVFLTADTSMRKVPAERRALAGSGLTIIFFKKGFHSLRIHDQACKLLKLWPEIVNAAERCPEPTVFEVTAQARKLQRVFPTRALLTH